MSHTIGAHSDDRGGEADNPCYCDVPKSPQPNLEWLDDIFEDLMVGHNFDYARAAIATNLEQVELEARKSQINRMINDAKDELQHEQAYVNSASNIDYYKTVITFLEGRYELKARPTQKGDSDEYPPI